VHPIELAAAGLAVGVVFGVLGAGGSAFATPVLALMGVPAAIAIASPMPAMVPAALAGVHGYATADQVDWRTARRAVAGGLPGVALGALASSFVGGPALLVLSGVLLAGLGARLLVGGARTVAEGRGRDGTPVGSTRLGRDRAGVVIAASAGVGFLTGLLANGGGFLFVPLFVLGLGLTTAEAAGTSMAAVAVLSLPTVASHWLLGHIEWSVALPFAAGLVPASVVGGRLARRMPPDAGRRLLGVMLLLFGVLFVATRVA
jgi:hypothetical protein